MYLKSGFFVTNANSNDWTGPQRYDIDTLLIYTLWYEFSNDCDAQSDLDTVFVTKKSTPSKHSYLKNCTNIRLGPKKS